MRPADQHGLQLAESVEPDKGWRACWGKLHCFASSSRKRGRRPPQLLPPPPPLASNNANLQISDSVPSSTSLSPLVNAPPSSPASFSYPDHLASPAALLTLFPLKSTEDICSNAATRMDDSFRGLDPILVTPPLHSTLTTEPTTPLSTAPFTPPPELAHLTTPSSPEVPFAEFVASSLNLKYAERVPEQASIEAALDPKLESQYQLCSGSPIQESGAPSVEVPSPLPERVPFLEDDGKDTNCISNLQTAYPFGFNQVTSVNAYGHGSPVLVYRHVPQLQKNQHAQTEDVALEIEGDAECSNEHVQSRHLALPTADAKFKCEAISNQKGLTLPHTAHQSRQRRIPEMTDDGHGVVSHKQQSACNSIVQRDSHDEQKQESVVKETHAPISAVRCIVTKHMDETQGSGKCPTCGVLTSKCRALSDALHESKEKLSSIEKKENILGDREKKFKQLIAWLQLEAKSQQASICRLSEELSWQELAFLDLQEKHLAELGIELSDDSSRECASTEVSS